MDAKLFYLPEIIFDSLQELKLQKYSDLSNIKFLAFFDENGRRTVKLVCDVYQLFVLRPFDPRWIKIFKYNFGLRAFFLRIFELLRSEHTLKLLLSEEIEKRGFDKSPESVLAEIDANIIRWEKIVTEKVNCISDSGNRHLVDLEFPTSYDRIPVKILELNPYNTLQSIHPITPVQAAAQERRSSEDLMKYDRDDPIMIKRVHRIGDKGNAPNSLLQIKNGHHRLYELYKRYLRGDISGETVFYVHGCD